MRKLPPEPERVQKTEDNENHEQKKYPCVFDLSDDCPIRRNFKLVPESLVRFCRICPILHEEIIDLEESITEDHPCPCEGKEPFPE